MSLGYDQDFLKTKEPRFFLDLCKTFLLSKFSRFNLKEDSKKEWSYYLNFASHYITCPTPCDLHLYCFPYPFRGMSSAQATHDLA